MTGSLKPSLADGQIRVSGIVLVATNVDRIDVDSSPGAVFREGPRGHPILRRRDSFPAVEATVVASGRHAVHDLGSYSWRSARCGWDLSSGLRRSVQVQSAYTARLWDEERGNTNRNRDGAADCSIRCPPGDLNSHVDPPAPR